LAAIIQLPDPQYMSPKTRAPIKINANHFFIEFTDYFPQNYA